jgi:hypothetical protein
MTVQLICPASGRAIRAVEIRSQHSRRSSAKVDALYAIELLLDRLADKHGISHDVISKAVSGYAEDMVGDILFALESELERERNEVPEIC